MKIARTKKYLFSIVLILALIVFSTGCATDLGTFSEDNDYEEYYESFGDVVGLFDGGELSYDVKDSLFNATAVTDLNWEDDDDAVQVKEYVYIVIPFEKEMTLESIALYVKADKDCRVYISAFYFQDDTVTPKKIKYLSSPDTETVEVDGQQVEVEIEYDDPVKADRISSAEMSLTKDEWGSFILSNFTQLGQSDGNLHTQEDGLLYIRVENNSGFSVSTLPSCPITFINLLVRKL